MASEIYSITFLRRGESVGNLENHFQYEPEHHNWRTIHLDDRPYWKED